MATTPEGQRLFIPALAPFYARVTDLAWPIIRLTMGGMLLAHGIPKWQAGAAAFATGSLARRGIEPSLPLAYAVIGIETDRRDLHRARLVHALLRGGRRDPPARGHVHPYAAGLRLDQPRLRVSADVGADPVRGRAARRRALFAGSQDRTGTLSRGSPNAAICLCGAEISGTADQSCPSAPVLSFGPRLGCSPSGS